jgi:hypothetical protein
MESKEREGWLWRDRKIKENKIIMGRNTENQKRIRGADLNWENLKKNTNRIGYWRTSWKNKGSINWRRKIKGRNYCHWRGKLLQIKV